MKTMLERNDRRIPRLMFTGSGSGSGKTTVTCAVMQALADRGLSLHAFKCGPDYIDPLFHQQAIGAGSSNLDLFFYDENTLRQLLLENAGKADIALMEGVMGYYDGVSMGSSEKSSYDIARVTKTPAVLIVNARGMAYSLVALVRGFLNEAPDSGLRGLILNKVSAAAYPAMKEAIERAFGPAFRVYGYLPPMPDCAFESRPLGLVPAGEIRDIKEKLRHLAQQAEQSIDLNGLMALASGAPDIKAKSIDIEPVSAPVRIAVAQDKAFCFYYQDNLRLLEKLGAELIPFSPISDACLPPCDGLYIGGGYPELHLKALCNNKPMRLSLRGALSDGLPCIAECGGFMYLTESIDDVPMVGFLGGACRRAGHLVRFGYTVLTARRDNLLCEEGCSFPVHEFHYYDCTQNGADFLARKPSGKSWPCGHASSQLYAGFPHLPFYSRPGLARSFCSKALKYHDSQEKQT